MRRALGIVVTTTTLAALVGCGRRDDAGGGPPPPPPPPAPAPAPAPFPPPGWNHHDLTEYLNQRGFALTLRNRPLLGREDRVVAALSDDRAGNAASILVYRFATEAEARAHAAAVNDGAVAVGAFALVPPANPTPRDRDLLRRVEAALRSPAVGPEPTRLKPTPTAVGEGNPQPRVPDRPGAKAGPAGPVGVIPPDAAAPRRPPGGPRASAAQARGGDPGSGRRFPAPIPL